MPMQPDRYPVDWPALAREIKDACDWQCQECGMQCRRPGEPYDTQRRTLTVAHWDHVLDASEVFLVALCPACHLRHDAAHHAQKRRQTRRRHHMTLIRQRQPEATVEDIADLAADWPVMPELEGVDLFLAACGEPYGGNEHNAEL